MAYIPFNIVQIIDYRIRMPIRRRFRHIQAIVSIPVAAHQCHSRNDDIGNEKLSNDAESASEPNADSIYLQSDVLGELIDRR
jgi:hypothetical protein